MVILLKLVALTYTWTIAGECDRTVIIAITDVCVCVLLFDVDFVFDKLLVN